MPAFHEIRFSIKISYGSNIGPSYSTFVYDSPSGAEQRVGYWSKGRKKLEVSLEDISRADLRYIEGFYRGRRGKLFGFRARDWNDYLAKDQGLGPITLVSGRYKAQLQIVYPDAINPETHIIRKPTLAADVKNDINDPAYSPDITIKRTNGGTTVIVTGWTLDRTTGLVDFGTSAPPAGVYTWSGSYDWPVRFDKDEALFSREALDTNNWQGITMIEILI